MSSQASSSLTNINRVGASGRACTTAQQKDKEAIAAATTRRSSIIRKFLVMAAA